MTETCNVLVALFVGMYGAFGMVLKITAVLNQRRDVVLGIEGKEGLSISHRRHVLTADWLPLWIGGLGFLLLAMIFFLAVPDIGGPSTPHAIHGLAIWRLIGLSALQVVSYLSAVLAFVGFNAMAWGGSMDLVRMREFLRRDSGLIEITPAARANRSNAA